MHLKENSHILPLIFGRKGGASINLLEHFTCPKTKLHFQQIFEQNERIDKLKKSFLKKLEEMIKRDNIPSIKPQLIYLRRDVFNDRNLEKYSPEVFDETIREFLLKLKIEEKDYAVLKKAYQVVFQKEYNQSIGKIKNISEEYFFKNGLLFSSLLLKRELDKCSFKFQALNKKERRLIHTALKYISRSTVKTTPFSSFNNIFCFSEKAHLYQSIKTSNKSDIQITNLFYYYLKKILSKDQIFRKVLYLKNNNTLWEQNVSENEVHFFLNNNNNETFKKIKASDTLVFIKHKLDSNEYQYGTFIDFLKEETEQPTDVVESYMNFLIEEGFLHLVYPVSMQNKNWMENLKIFLSEIPNASVLIHSIIELLKTIGKTQMKLQTTLNSNFREEQILKAHQKITFFLDNSGSDFKSDFLKKVKPQDLFYEDTFFDEAKAFDKTKIDAFVPNIIELYSKTNVILSQKRKLIKQLTNYFRALQQDKMPLLSFYDRIYLKNELNMEIETDDVEALKAIIFEVKKVLKKTDELEYIDVNEFLTKSENNPFGQTSFGVFIQEINDWEKVVINNFTGGYGSNVSRFLGSFPKRYTNEIIDFNEREVNKKIIEIRDASIHNVNNHPFMTKRHIDLSRLYNSKDSISLSNLSVLLNKKGDLTIQDNKGSDIQITCFSMETLHRKSKFIQFLNVFNKADPTGYQLLLQNITELFIKRNNDREVIRIPPIVYKEQVILQREKWYVNKRFLEKKLPNDKLENAYLVLNTFFKKNKVPEQLFVKILNREKDNPLNDNYKPQFIDYTKPAFASLFLSLIKKSKTFIELTRVTPDISTQKMDSGFVSEYTLNLYT